MRKVIYTILLSLFAGFTFGGERVTPDQKTLEEIISGHIDAYGGESVWNMIEALEVKGRFTAFSETDDFYTLKTVYGKFYSDYSLGKNRIKEWHDGTNFHTVDPWQGFDFPRRINKTERHTIMQKAEFFTPFFRWKERGLDVVLEGKKTIDGNETYKLIVTRPGLQPETWYLDTKTLLAYKSITPWVDFAVSVTAETFYDDYREVSGILIPHFKETTYSTRHITTEIDTVIINPSFNNQIFSPPACRHMEKLDPLIGSWNITVEYMTRSGNLHIFDEIKADFRQAREKLIEGKLSYEVSLPVSTHYTIHYNQRTKKYQLVVYNGFYSTTELFEGTFENKKLIFKDTSQSLSTSAQNPNQGLPPITQFVLILGEENNIILKRNRSTDAGATWLPAARYTFTGM